MICDYLYYKQLCYLYVCLYVLFTFPTSRVVILLVITVTKMYPHMYICVYVNVYAWHMHTSNRPWFCRCGREYTHKKNKHVFAISTPSTGSQCLELLGDQLASYL